MKSVFFVFLMCSVICCQDRIINDSVFFSDTPLKDPTTSILLSMAIPGAGQFYNESYVRSTLYFSLVSYFAITAIINQNRIRDIKDGHVIFSSDAARSNQIDTYFNKRNIAIWRSFGFYLLNILDAWAGSYLFGFDDIMDSEKTSNLSLSPTAYNEIQLKFTYHF